MAFERHQSRHDPHPNPLPKRSSRYLRSVGNIANEGSLVLGLRMLSPHLRPKEPCLMILPPRPGNHLRPEPPRPALDLSTALASPPPRNLPSLDRFAPPPWDRLSPQWL